MRPGCLSQDRNPRSSRPVPLRERVRAGSTSATPRVHLFQFEDVRKQLTSVFVVRVGGVRPQPGDESSTAAISGGRTVKRRPIGSRPLGNNEDSRPQRSTAAKVVNDELEEPMRIVQLGRSGLYIEPDKAGRYLLHGSDGHVIAAPFTREDAARFARELLRWVREPDPEEYPGS